MTKPSIQRATDAQHAPKRRTGPHRHPRAQVLGFTPRQWPFIFVLIGNWLFAARFYGLCKLFWHWAGPMDRCRPPRTRGQGCRLAILPAVLAICIIAAQRLNPSMFVGRIPKPNSAVDINNRPSFSTRSSISSSISSAMRGIALYCPPEEARTLIILTALFLMGRVLFWVGYHYNPYMRAFGFGITFYPTVTVYLWLILYMEFGIHAKL